MIYVRRNTSKKIIDIRFDHEEGLDEVGLFDPELKEFLADSQNKNLVKSVMEKLDLSMIRVIEDMIDILIAKGLILFTDLPQAVQNKLLFKRSIRQSINDHTIIISEEEILQF